MVIIKVHYQNLCLLFTSIKQQMIYKENQVENAGQKGYQKKCIKIFAYADDVALVNLRQEFYCLNQSNYIPNLREDRLKSQLIGIEKVRYYIYLTVLISCSIVNSVCFSLDGNTLASGSSDNSIRLWDVKTGQTIQLLDNRYNKILEKCKISLLQKNPFTVLPFSAYPKWQFLLSQGGLVLKGEFVNYQSNDLRQLLKSKGSCFLQSLMFQKITDDQFLEHYQFLQLRMAYYNSFSNDMFLIHLFIFCLLDNVTVEY